MIHQQSVFEPWPIESESVQAVICSPPYYALRTYNIEDIVIGGDKDCKHEFVMKQTFKANFIQGGAAQRPHNFEMQKNSIAETGFCTHCNAWKGQYGLEPTPAAFIEHTRLWAKEAWRVLRNDGIMFLNLADSYNSQPIGRQVDPKRMSSDGEYSYDHKKPFQKDYPSKCQLLIPHRVAIALVEDGWTLRNTIVWYKTNGMPESVTDRFSKKHEYIFMFTKQEKYYFDLDDVREPIITQNRAGIRKEYDSKFNNNIEAKNQASLSKARQLKRSMGLPEGHINGKNPGDIWIIPTSPSSEKHFAMWPERLVERMVKCSTKAGDIVLDCFAGSATTLKVAEQLNRKGIGIDLGYHEISKRRTSKIQKEMFI